MMPAAGESPAMVTVPPVRLAWKRDLALAVGALYVPLLLMCCYTLLCVPCDHCKRSVWIVAPFAPGGFVWEWTRHFLQLPHPTSAVGAIVSGVLSVLITVGLAAWLRRARGRRWRYILLATILVAATFLAYAVFTLMRA
jgi:hypothetical protein